MSHSFTYKKGLSLLRLEISFGGRVVGSELTLYFGIISLLSRSFRGMYVTKTFRIHVKYFRSNKNYTFDKGVRLYIPFSVIGQGVMITPHKIMKLIILSVDFNNKNHCGSEKF